MRESLERFRVHMDRFFSERSLHERGRDRGGARAARRRLRARRRALAAHDRVRRRQGPRAARARRRVDLLRARHRLPPGQARARLRPRDRHLGRRPPRLHQPHARRLARRSAATPSAFEILIMQLVNLTESGERVQMSKRAGAIVTPRRPARRHRRGRRALVPRLAQQRHHARPRPRAGAQQSQDNPVYYVQYAHARIASILRKAGEERVAQALDGGPAGERRAASTPRRARW